jgi:uncharacterized protein (TIGR00730 family)
MGTYEKSVTFFGSARLPATDPYYQKAYRLGKRCAELGYAVATGGGPGIMEAANKGAHEVGGRSIGITIQLPMEQSTNPYVNEEIPFYYFFTRKVALAYSAEVYIYFPGGFGTLDELFGILTLSQTNKIPPVPIILVGEKFWEPLLKMSEGLRDIYKTIDATDMNFFTITDDEEKIMEIVKNAPIRKGE